MDKKAAISEIANQVLSQTDIVQVIGERIELTNRGKSHVACCPFHSENTPSFHVMHKDQYYYCFGCKASGNAIHFLREYDRMSFFEALNYLARQAGIEMPALNQHKPEHSQADFDCLENASKRFQQNLRDDQVAIDYLKNRAITGTTAKTFGLGFAKDQWDDILNHLSTGSSDSLDRLHTHGLVITNDKGRRYDRFRNRITFPIRDSRGRTIGFGARTLGDDTPKYLNSPQTPLFHKSDVLYGVYELLESCRHPEFILVTEGYMDVIALHQAGIPQVVATLGTASNRGQLRQLQRYTDRIVVCFDGDTAGKKAAWHALTEALPIANEKMDLRFLFLPEGEDPDSYVNKNGPDNLRALIGQAQPLSETFFEHLFDEHDLSSLDGKARCAKAAMESIETMPPGLLRKMLTEELAKRLDIDSGTLQGEPELVAEAPAPIRPRPRSDKPVAPILRALALLLKDTQLLGKTTTLGQLSKLAHQLQSPPRELKLLVAVYEKLNANTELNTGQLINLFENEQLQQYLLELSSSEDAIATELQASELIDAIALSIKWCINAQTEELIDLGKTRPLNDEEKQRLHQLLLSGSRSGIKSSQD
jgi:DNA primase